MIFYNKNQEHDRQFLELQTKLNFSFWIASDAQHYFENCEKSINTYEYEQLVKQFNLATGLVQNIHIPSSNMSLDHIKCLNILKNFVLFSIDELNFSKPRLKDSESEDIYLRNSIEFQENFIRNYLPYLYPNELESYMQKSYLLFTKAFDFIDQTILTYEYKDYGERYKKNADKALHQLNLAVLMVEQAIKDPFVVEGILDECSIMGLDNFSDQDIETYTAEHFRFMKLWKEFFLAFEQSYKELYKKDQDHEELNTEMLMLDYQTRNYYGLINVNAIKIHQFMFEKMGVELPKIEIFSHRTIKSPIDYIQNKRFG